jgi:GntR family transcriptional regulator
MRLVNTRAGGGGPVYRQLEKYLRDEIRAGRLKPGDQLPSEPELANLHGMARMTARRAIEALLADGLLVRRRGRGTFVASPRLAYPPATAMSFSRTMRALGHEVTTRLLDFVLSEPPDEVALDLNIADGARALLVRRLRFVAGEPVAIHMNYMDGSYFDVLRASDLLTRPISEAMREASGVHVASSRDYLEGVAAPRDEAGLLHVSAGDPMLLVVGVAYSDEGLPILATRGWYRADRFRFAVGVSGLGVSFELNRRND